MGLCKFCNRPAGFLRKQHKECLQKHTQAQEQIQLAIQEAYQQHNRPPRVRNFKQLFKPTRHKRVY
ncbi:hypothetical protein [Helicobacter labacensis]|uniref:hypothetical protein n=1 Tax=Helicobacter labacensis TaxID=2316079 RepID=UPI000EABCCAC|nr:hypothetical protein [Helicobacter labacensis]